MIFHNSWYRFKQFRAAVSSRLNHSDVEFVRQHLSKPEQVLFYRLGNYDQYHSLRLAHNGRDKYQQNDWLNPRQLVRAALMHDIGKAWHPLSLWSRVLYVLANKYDKKGKVQSLWTDTSRYKLFRDLYVLQNHGQLGARMLVDMGVRDTDILEVVANHHEKPTVRESRLLPLIRELDNRS